MLEPPATDNPPQQTLAAAAMDGRWQQRRRAHCRSTGARAGPHHDRLLSVLGMAGRPLPRASLTPTSAGHTSLQQRARSLLAGAQFLALAFVRVTLTDRRSSSTHESSSSK